MQYHQQIQLKNGTVCTLQSPGPEDASAILRHMAVASGETENMLRYPEEFNMTAEEEAAYLDTILSSSDAIMIAAFVDGQIVANAGFNPVSSLTKCRHRAELGISVRRKYWGCGIGSAIMAALLAAARQAGYEQMELNVVSDNRRAIALYEALGFRVYGTNERGFRTRSGGYQSLLLMFCRL